MVLRKKILISLLTLACAASLSMAQTSSEVSGNMAKTERSAVKKSRTPVRARVIKKSRFGTTPRVVNNGAKIIDSTKVVASPAPGKSKLKNRDKK